MPKGKTFLLFLLVNIFPAFVFANCHESLLRINRHFPKVFSQQTSTQFKVAKDGSNFTLKTTWKISGVTYDEVMSARHLVGLNGPNGMNNALIASKTRRTSEGVVAKNTRPKGMPAIAGSDLKIVEISDGLRATLSGPFGNGSSDVMVGRTTYDDLGVPSVEITEIGKFHVGYKAKTPLPLLPFEMAGRILSLTKPGKMMSRSADEYMAKKHTETFDAGKALANAVQENRKKSRD